MEEKLSEIFSEVNIKEIYNDERAKFKKKYQNEAEAEELLLKVDKLFTYAIESNVTLLSIPDKTVEKWGTSAFELEVQSKLKSLFAKFRKKGFVKTVDIPISDVIQPSELAKYEIMDKFKEKDKMPNFLEELQNNHDTILIRESLEKLQSGIDESEEERILNNLYKKFVKHTKKGEQLPKSKRTSLNEIVDVGKYSFDKIKDFLSTLKGTEKEKVDFMKEVQKNSKWINFDSEKLNIESDLSEEIRPIIEKTITQFVEKRNVSKVFLKLTDSGETDPVIDVIVENFYDLAAKDLSNLKKGHYQYMSAENINGLLLESFIADIVETDGWIWCSGEIYRAVDFCKVEGEHTKLLQIKNKYNSENSSSTKVRKGTDIKKWHRLSKSGDNWKELANLLEINDTTKLNEESYHKYIVEKISAFKENKPTKDIS
jgi:type II restriction enzyme sinI